MLSRNPEPSAHDIRSAIAGNICRCTGYERIVQSVFEAAKLRNRATSEGRRMSLADLSSYQMQHVPDVAALCDLLHQRRDEAAGTVLLAGGTDFMVEISQGGLHAGPLPLVVDVSRLDELRQISWQDGVMRIGAGVSYLTMQRHPDVKRYAPVIERMTYDVGGPTIQARGTLGGNIATASPAADGVGSHRRLRSCHRATERARCSARALRRAADRLQAVQPRC